MKSFPNELSAPRMEPVFSLLTDKGRNMLQRMARRLKERTRLHKQTGPFLRPK
jgi:hypothetical protein